MGWFIEGAGGNLQLGVSEQGNRRIWGTPETHDPSTAGPIQPSTLSRLKASSCFWEILSSDDGRIDSPLSPDGLARVAPEDLDRAIAAICFHENPDMVSMTIVLPKKNFSDAFDLFKTVLTSSGISYHISLGFHGFGEDERSQPPTETQFLKRSRLSSGIPYFSTDVSFLIRRATNTR